MRMMERCGPPVGRIAGRIAGPLALALLVTGVLVLRRPDQLLDPYVWIEEVLTIPQILHHGLLALFLPIQGYIILPPKVIALAATGLSFFHYPELAYALTLLVSAGVALLVALAPTLLRWRWACALLVFLIPTDPEIFGLAHMTFWLTSLPGFLVLLWRQGERPLLRAACVLVAGLSSPVMIGLLPLYALRAWWTRRRDDALLCLLGALTGAAQVVAMLPWLGYMESPRLAILWDLMARRLFGGFVARAGGLPPDWELAAGLALCVFLLAVVLAAALRRDWVLPALGACLGVVIVLVVARAPADVITPAGPGPRYFFFPYVLLMWMLAQMAARGPLPLRAAGAGLILLALGNLPGVFARHHEHLDWRFALAACLEGDERPIPIHTTGERTGLWPLRLTPAECRDLLGRGLFGPPGPATLARTLERGTIALPPSRLGPPLAGPTVEAEGWAAGAVFSGIPTPAMVAQPYGSFVPSDAGTGRLLLGPLRAPGGVVALPVVVGPSVGGLSLAVIRRGTGETVRRIDLAGIEPQRWRFLKLELGSGAEDLAILAVDAGSGWGQWFAIGAPMAVTDGG